MNRAKSGAVYFSGERCFVIGHVLSREGMRVVSRPIREVANCASDPELGAVVLEAMAAFRQLDVSTNDFGASGIFPELHKLTGHRSAVSFMRPTKSVGVLLLPHEGEVELYATITETKKYGGFSGIRGARVRAPVKASAIGAGVREMRELCTIQHRS